MNKFLKILLIIIATIVILGIGAMVIAFMTINNIANSNEIELGSDTINTVKVVVGERKVTGASTQVSNGVTTKTIKYNSDTVQEDLITYVQYLRNEAGFQLTKDMNLAIVPSMVELAKTSQDSGQIIMLKIEYNDSEYTITVQKGKGTLNLY